MSIPRPSHPEEEEACSWCSFTGQGYQRFRSSWWGTERSPLILRRWRGLVRRRPDEIGYASGVLGSGTRPLVQ